jgi:hypothetical protein
MAVAKVGSLFRHYKDPRKQYEVLADQAVSTNNLVPMVVYRQLCRTPDFPRGTIWCRLKSEFEGKVEIKNEEGVVVKTVDRFELVDPNEPEVF